MNRDSWAIISLTFFGEQLEEQIVARKEVEGQLREAQSVCEALQRERDLAQTRVCIRNLLHPRCFSAGIVSLSVAQCVHSFLSKVSQDEKIRHRFLE